MSEALFSIYAFTRPTPADSSARNAMFTYPSKQSFVVHNVCKAKANNTSHHGIPRCKCSKTMIVNACVIGRMPYVLTYCEELVSYWSGRLHGRRLQVKERELAGLTTKFVDEARS